MVKNNNFGSHGHVRNMKEKSLDSCRLKSDRRRTKDRLLTSWNNMIKESLKVHKLNDGIALDRNDL